MPAGMNKPMIVEKGDIGITATHESFKTGLTDVVHYVEWGDTASAGEVTIETAGSPNYTGTWAVAKVFTFAGPARVDIYPLLGGGYVYWRHRISQSIVGGTVSTRMAGTAE